MKLYQSDRFGSIKPIEIDIPENVVPIASGLYVIEKLKNLNPDATFPVSTANTIQFAAQEAEKEGLRLKRVKLGLSLNSLNLFSLNLGKCVSS